MVPRYRSISNHWSPCFNTVQFRNSNNWSFAQYVSHTRGAVCAFSLNHSFKQGGKGWALKRARPTKKMWCSGMGLSLEMSPVFNFGHDQGLRCGLSIRHCRCNWIMAPWVVFLHFFLAPLCCYAVSERQMLLIFCGRFTWSRQTSLSNGFSGYFHDSTTELYFRSISRQCRCYSTTKTTKSCLKQEGKSHPWQS